MEFNYLGVQIISFGQVENEAKVQIMKTNK